MTTVTAEVLSSLTIEALERTAFVLAFDSDEDQAPRDTVLQAHISYAGSSSGVVSIDASAGFAEELASSMLGVEPEQISATQEGLQALLELANIIAGSVLRHLGAEHRRFQLGLPQAGPCQSMADGAACALESESGPFIVTWRCTTDTEESAAA